MKTALLTAFVALLVLVMASSAWATKCTDFDTYVDTLETKASTFSCDNNTVYNFALMPLGATKEDFAKTALGLDLTATDLEVVNRLTGRSCFILEALKNMIVCP